MTVENQTPYQSFTANGSQTNFALGFYVDDKNHFEINKNDQAVSKNDYSYNSSSNSIVFNSTPKIGDVIEVKRSTSADRATNYATYNNTFRPETLNKDIDRIWLKIQELGVEDMLLRVYVDRMHIEQKDYIDNKDQIIQNIINDLRNYVNQQDNGLNSQIINLKNYVNHGDTNLSNSINSLRNYTDQQDSNQKVYFENLITSQGTSLKQLNDQYNGLMQRIATIAVSKGWDASLIADINGLNQQQINDQWVDVSLLLKDGELNATYNTNQLKSAIIKAQITGKGLRCAYRNTVHINDDLNFSGIRYIDFQANIIVLNDKQLSFGEDSGGSNYHEIKFKNVTNGQNTTVSDPPTRPLIKINGLKCSKFSIGQCNYFQLYADASNTKTASTAYNNIYLTGQISKFEITDANVPLSWVNENKIYGGRINKIHIKGVAYKHNKNEFYGPTIENADSGTPRVELIFDNCSNNHIYSSRFESITNPGAIIFTSTTRSNYVFKNYGHSGGSRENFTDFSKIVIDEGENNLFASEESVFFEKRVLAAFDAKSDTVLATGSVSTTDNGSIGPIQGDYSAMMIPNFDSVNVGVASGKSVITTELIAVEKHDVFSIYAKYEGNYGVIRFYLYDENLQPIFTDTADRLMLSPILTYFNSQEGFYANGAARDMDALNEFPYLINSSNVKYVRVVFRLSSPNTKLYSVSLTKFHKKHSGQNYNYAIAPQKKPMLLNGMATRGFAKLGQSYYDSTVRNTNTCILSLETYVTESAESGSNLIKLKHTSAATPSEIQLNSIKVGDIIGVRLTDGSVHWTQIASISDNIVTLNNALTSSVNTGAMVRVNRWNYLTQRATFAEMTIAENTVTTRNFTLPNTLTVGAKVSVSIADTKSGYNVWAEVISGNTVKVSVQNTTAASITINATTIGIVVQNS